MSGQKFHFQFPFFLQLFHFQLLQPMVCFRDLHAGRGNLPIYVLYLLYCCQVIIFNLIGLIFISRYFLLIKRDIAFKPFLGYLHSVFCSFPRVLRFLDNLLFPFNARCDILPLFFVDILLQIVTLSFQSCKKGIVLGVDFSQIHFVGKCIFEGEQMGTVEIYPIY